MARPSCNVLLAGVLACLAAAPVGLRAKTFRAADNQVEDYPTVQALLFMGRYVEEKTGGRHRIQVFHSGELGDERNTIEQTRRGVLDIDRVNITPLTALVPATKAILLPFQFRSLRHMHAVLDGPVGDDVLARFEAAGLVGLTFYDSGARSLYNDVRPVRTIEDMRGLKIRIQPSDLMADFVTALGARPVELPYNLVLPALQTKVVDGAENNWSSYVSTGHFRAARHITLTEHVMAPEVLLMSRRAWGELTPEDRAIFREAAHASRAYMRERWLAWEDANRDRAVQSGSVVTAEFDRPAFEAAVRAVRSKYLADAEVGAVADLIEAVP